MEMEEDGEQGQDYLTPVLSHALFPAQASAEAKKLYAALQEYAKHYSWVGMGRIHKGLREQVQVYSKQIISRYLLFRIKSCVCQHFKQFYFGPII